jgi:phytoene dehydrogenase-like protein
MSRKVAILGAGIASLTAGAWLAQRGYQVKLYEKAVTVGGSAGWYVRKQHSFPTGATIAFGLEEGGILRRILDELQITSKLSFCSLEYPMDVLLADRTIAIYQNEQQWYEELSRVFHERSDAVVAFWRQLSKISKRVEEVTKTGVALPIRHIYDLGSLPGYLARNLGATWTLARHCLLSVESLLKRYALADYEPFRSFLNAQLVDAAQIDISKAALLPSSVALDIYRRGSYAIEGGLAAVCRQLADCIAEAGGDIQLRTVVQSCFRDSQIGKWIVQTKQTETADIVIDGSGNQLVQRQITQKRKATEQWGAFRLDMILRDLLLEDLAPLTSDQLPFAWQVVPERSHASIFGDQHGPVYFTLHCATDANGERIQDELMLTASVHTNVSQWLSLDKLQYETKKQRFTEAMLTELEKVCPAIRNHMLNIYSGSPLTYRKFIGKVEVGGAPLTVKNAILQARGVDGGEKGLFYVGEQVFPGPGTLSCALSGFYAARAILHQFPVVLE